MPGSKPGGRKRLLGAFRGPTNTFSRDFAKMKPVKIIPDDSNVYMYLVLGIALGYILAVIGG